MTALGTNHSMMGKEKSSGTFPTFLRSEEAGKGVRNHWYGVWQGVLHGVAALLFDQDSLYRVL